MFRVKVVGTYIARSGVMEKEKVKKSYEIEGNIPTTYAALSIVKNKLLSPALAKKYPDYVAFLTYHITEIVPLDEQSRKRMKTDEVSFMDRKSLLDYIRDNGLASRTEYDQKTKTDIRLGVIPEYYPNLFRLREAVQFAKDDPYGYAKHFSLKEADLKMDLEMAACNPGLFQDDSAGAEGLIASTKLSHPAPVQELDSSKPHNPSKPHAAPVRPKASSPSVLAAKTAKRLEGFKQEEIADGQMGDLDTPDVGDL